jgi:hypothetical protein
VASYPQLDSIYANQRCGYRSGDTNRQDHLPYLDAARLERIQQVFIPLVESADDKAAMVVIRAQERKATLMGDNAPLRVDPIQLAETARPKPSSTQATLEVFERLQAEDKQAEKRQRELAPDDDD